MGTHRCCRAWLGAMGGGPGAWVPRMPCGMWRVPDVPYTPWAVLPGGSPALTKNHQPMPQDGADPLREPTAGPALQGDGDTAGEPVALAGDPQRQRERLGQQTVQEVSPTVGQT